MKLKRLITILVLTFFVLTIYSCKQRFTNYQTECHSLNTDGYIILDVWNTKELKEYNIELASKYALHSVLYSGVAGTKSCSTQAPLLNTEKEIENFKKIEKRFFSKKGDWERFVKSSQTENISTNTSDANKIKPFKIYISKNQLRIYLEEKNIITKLNKGF